MTLITESYREQNQRLHEDPSYGIRGQKWKNYVYELCEKFDTLDVLDYGCGKQTLQEHLGFAIKHYDPAILGLDELPQAADIVACVDVLEHIEPDCLDDVLDHLASVTKKAAFITVATRPARKTLPDGRNAHLIQEDMAWWLPKICQRFRVVKVEELMDDDKPVGFLVIGRKKD